MAGLFDLEGHLVFYRSYHFNKANVAIHLVCIPIILLSTITFLSNKQIPVSDDPYINAGTLLAFIYGFYYILLDWKCGIPSFLVLNGYAYLVRTYYLTLAPEAQTQFIHYAYYAHVASWVAQFYGHGVHEKRAPALMDNLLQALVLAPFFVAFEIAFALGYRSDLKKSMDNKAGAIVRDFKLKDKKKI